MIVERRLLLSTFLYFLKALMILHYFDNKRLIHSSTTQAPITKVRDSKMTKPLICHEEAFSTLVGRDKQKVNDC